MTNAEDERRRLLQEATETATERTLSILQRFQPTESLPDLAALRIGEVLASAARSRACPGRLWLSNIRTVWLLFKARPFGSLGPSVLMAVFGGIWAWHLVQFGPLAGTRVVWTLLAPWMALLATLPNWEGRRPHRDVLSHWVQVAPLAPWMLRFWQWTLLAVLDLLLVTILTVVTGLGRGELGPALLGFILPFLASVMVALWASLWLRERWSMVVAALAALNTGLGIVAWSGHGPLRWPLESLLSLSEPWTLLGLTALIAGGWVLRLPASRAGRS